MQGGDVAETDNELGITSGCSNIHLVGDPIRAFTAACCEDRPNIGIAKRCVKIRKSLLVSTRKVVSLMKGMFAEVDFQPPAFQDLRMP